ncbi:MAG: hypothetical protein ACI35J_06700 [Peribacillus sp.]
MKRGFNKKQLFLLSGSFLILILLFIFLYFYLLDPVKKELVAKTSELKNEEQILSMVQMKVETGAGIDFESTTELQKRLPVQPLTDQFVLNMEKAEVVSNSFIIDMEFTDGETSEETVLDEATEEATSTDDASGSSENRAQDSETTENENSSGTANATATTPKVENNVQEAPGTLPNSLKKISAKINVRSSSYEEMLEFIRTIQSTNRIVTIDSLTFKGAEEITKRDQNLEPLKYELIVTAYYYPSLTDLQDQTPIVATPKPSEKKNPFSTNERDDADMDTGN